MSEGLQGERCQRLWEGGSIQSPNRADVEPQPDAAIDIAIFKVLYGAFKLDITDRITQKAKVSEEGAYVDQAKIPNGNHKLTVQVADTKGRLAEKLIAFEVQ